MVLVTLPVFMISDVNGMFPFIPYHVKEHFREYLSMLLPANWEQMDVFDRRSYVRDTLDPTRPVGTVQRQYVSNMEIWCECFGKNKEDMKPSDSYAIAAIMKRLKGWEKSEDRRRIPIYGLQRLYVRKK